MRDLHRMAGALLGATALIALGPLAGSAGSDTTLAGSTATTLAVGAQFAFNVPNIVPLPNENLIEEDAPFARTNVSGGPVVDSIAAPYYPGDIAADLGSLLSTFGFPGLPLNDPLLAESKFPVSPGYPAHKTFGIAPASGTPLVPSIFSSTADATSTGGDATGTISDLALDNVTSALSTLLGAKPGASLLDVGNISATNSVTQGTSAITATSTSQVKTIAIAGLIDVGGLTATATATSDGTTATPTASLHLGQVTVDGQSAYIDDTGVHILTTSTGTTGITPAQLQQTVDATLAQDGISVRVLDPKLTTNGAAGSADAGGLVIAISHQFDIPFIPGEPTIPLPELGNVGLPAGLYTASTSITFGLAQASVAATGTVTGNSGAAGTGNSGAPSSSVPSLNTLGAIATGNSGVGSFGGGSVQSLAATGPGSAVGSGAVPAAASPSTATDFPIHGIPPPLGWSIAALLACILMAYPLLLLARWQFLAGRRA